MEERSDLPDGIEFGKTTLQSLDAYPDPDTSSEEYHHNLKTDADQIRNRFGIARFEDDYEYRPYPNCLIHEPIGVKNPGTSHEGGTNWFATGEKGSGKSTFGLYWAQRLMEVNDEAVVWRGSSSRSEWLPFKPWTRLFLPANVDIDARWKPRDIRQDSAGEPAELEDVVREVIYYESPKQVNKKLQPGTFNVVYPDPSFSGCEDIFAESDYMTQTTEWVPKWDAEPGEATPIIHWWFAWAISKVEYGPYDWVSLIFDEVADLAPDSARADRHETYEKIQALRRVMADSRKFYFSLYFLGHHEENLHSKIRRTIQWRISMPDGTANPNSEEDNHRPPVGFSKIPMDTDMLSDRSIGNAIFWNEKSFNPIKWDDIWVFEEDTVRWLKISLNQPSTRARGDLEADTGGVADD